MKTVVLLIVSFFFLLNLQAQWEWQSPRPTSNFIFGVDFVDENHGWAVGYSGELIYTTDGGQNWQSQYSGTDQDLTAVWFTNFTGLNHGWITGMDGTILHTIDGGLVWTPEFPKEKSKIELHIYPNPFSTFTTFEYELDKTGYISLEVFNNLGQKEFIMNEYQEEGNQGFRWYPDGILPGIYFYRFKASEQTSNGKLILLR